jgi:hypothetical protein
VKAGRGALISSTDAVVKTSGKASRATRMRVREIDMMQFLGPPWEHVGNQSEKHT